MENNLMKIHELITNIEKNMNNNKKVRENCSQLEEYIQYIEPATQYHYMLFLVEIYATKLRDFESAEMMCKKVIQDRRPTVELEGILRMNFINALQHRYTYSIQNLEQADQISQNKPDLETVLLNYFQRMFLYSKESNLLNGLKCQEQQQYDEAIQYYNQEFQNQAIDEAHIENKYYAAKAIIRLINSFSVRRFNGVDSNKYREYLEELEEEKEQHDNNTAIEKIDKNYQYQKTYFKKIIDLILKKQYSLKKSRAFNKNIPAQFSIQLQYKRTLAILKLRKVLSCQKKLHPLISAEFRKCLTELQHNSINNYSMLHEFTLKEFKIANRGTELIKKMFRKPVLIYLKNTFLGQGKNTQIKSKRPSLFQNLPSNEGESPTRFTRHPIQDEIANGSFQFKMKQINTDEASQQSSNFTGSYMEKINQTSEGHETRYFHFLKEEMNKGKMKLYYNSKQSKISSDDNYYDLKNYKELIEGKSTKALKRKECEKFEQDRCFSIMLDDKSYKNFYVPDKKDYRRWIQVFKKYENIKGIVPPALKNSISKTKMESKIRKTVVFG